MTTRGGPQLQRPADPAERPPRPRRCLLDLDDFTRDELEELMEAADAMSEVMRRSVKKVPTLQGKSVVTLFYEASTRTRVSFEQAGKMLSADVINLAVASSSAVKGESLLNTARTLQATGADAIVIRHQHSGAPDFLARHVDAAVINAGDGWHAHPTQGLLDLYTLRKALGSVESARIAIVGDVLHSRVARSNIWGLTAAGAQVVLCGPPTLLPLDWLRARQLDGLLASVSVTTDVGEALEGADAVMALRLQQERQDAGLVPSLRDYARNYQINEARMARAKPGAPVLHPGPINEGVEISSETAHGPRSRIDEQVANGVAVRMAVLHQLVSRRRDGRSHA